jgi:hypothetical protein
LHVQLRRDRRLDKEIADILLDVGVFAETIRLVMELAGADGKLIVNAGDDRLVAARPRCRRRRKD